MATEHTTSAHDTTVVDADYAQVLDDMVDQYSEAFAELADR